MPRPQTDNPLFDILKAQRGRYDPDEVVRLFSCVGRERVNALAGVLAQYIGTNLPEAIAKRDGLSDYRTNPYVLLTCASVMKLTDPARFADFLFNNKLYMGLETSFGKSIEAAILGSYPLDTEPSAKWIDPPEKVAEARSLVGLSREQKAKRRRQSVWREIDKSCVLGKRRYLISVKSGPNCINDTQVQAMTDAISTNHSKWLEQTKRTYPQASSLDIIIGLTYGTDRTTNNKENQILAKLLGAGFSEEDRRNLPGVLIARKGRATRVHRQIGREFWATIGSPSQPGKAQFVFLEVLLALAKALNLAAKQADLETRINLKIQSLCNALSGLMFPRKGLPSWVSDSFSDTELFWFATALSAFYDEGI
ncbi:MAG: hypothetical protein HZA90_06275 [Verrucomicrobia bacterium]|nr:hypothetical protein [Verrucomicrobiota bacterium]